MPSEPDAPRDAPAPGDPYSRVDYRRLVRWRARIEREGPFLLEQLGRAPARRVLDVGCGTGEHVAFFAQQGAEAVGLDRSESMIAAARDHEAAGHGRFVLGDAADAARLLADEAPFGLALCLGNVLPHLQTDDELARWIAALRAVLAPGGRLLVQLLNYTRILERGERHLPLDVRAAPDAEDPRRDDPRKELVFLRLMRDAGDGRVLFFPTTLEFDPDAEEPARVVTSRRVPLRAWQADELRGRLDAAGFDVERFGDMTGGAFTPGDSRDLVVLAIRR